MSVQFGARKRVTLAGVIGLSMALVGLRTFIMPVRAHAAAQAGFYQQTNLVSDQPDVAAIQDSNLVNPWGVTLSGGSPFWVANNVTGTSTLYSGDVGGSAIVRSSLIVTIPGGSPTGVVANATNDFVVHSGTSSGPARFIFASQTGVISGWNPGVPPPPPSTNAQIGGTGDAVYTGLAIGQSGGANYLYAAGFEHNAIDVYDKTFQHVTLDGSFSDSNVPNSYSVFNIQNLGGRLYVTYAQQNHKEPDEETDRGSGFVDVFDTSGHLRQRLIKGNHLNAPWGLALAPADFGPFSNALIVGNFGNGHLQAFDPDSGRFLGELSDAGGKPIVIDGLWGITFGNGGSGGDRNALYFASGPDDETHGLFGSLRFNGGAQ